ncbi:MAG: flagellar FliJ family protein [Candidatus Brocadia sapporoensis]|nr:flagellar FliJ family protein [Candidatus Brocadia sapporoensis]QQR67200.1 MAG: flagellar FliJ family protein [Candidatus Brocadia sp.]
MFLQSVLTLKQSEMEKALHAQRDAKVFVYFESYFLKLSHDITIQAAKVKEVLKKTESVKNTLLNVFKKRKVLEKLHERQEKEYKKQVLTLENKQFDEIATSRFYQKYKSKNIC